MYSFYGVINQMYGHRLACISLCFNSHFFRVDVGKLEPEYHGSGFLELRMMEVVVATGAINRHHQQTNTQIFTQQILFLSPNQLCQSTEG